MKHVTEAQMKSAVATLLMGMGLDPEEPGLIQTPRRVVGYLMEYSGQVDPEEVLKDGFESPNTDSHAMVVQSGIPFRMACEHHLLPAVGRAAIGYIPGDRVIGLSKLTRLVQAVGTERPSLQEAITERVANILSEKAKPKGVIVVTRAEHTCMACRGINAPGVQTMCSSVKGVYRDVPHARAEFFDLIGGSP